MNNKLFNEMISGFVEAKKYRAGKKAKMRVSRVAFEAVSMKPAEIRRIRTRLRFSQPEFAEFLCTRVGALRSWEQGSRKPQSSASSTGSNEDGSRTLGERRCSTCKGSCRRVQTVPEFPELP